MNTTTKGSAQWRDSSPGPGTDADFIEGLDAEPVEDLDVDEHATHLRGGTHGGGGTTSIST